MLLAVSNLKLEVPSRAEDPPDLLKVLTGMVAMAHVLMPSHIGCKGFATKHLRPKFMGGFCEQHLPKSLRGLMSSTSEDWQMCPGHLQLFKWQSHASSPSLAQFLDLQG